MREILQGLNPEQRQAVTTTEGPLLVLAGAGTGKTRVITVRIAWLLARGVEPERVLAVTFTNKAAAEMRERVAALVGAERAARLTVGTFHAFALSLVRERAAELGRPGGLSICDSSDQLAAMRSALRELHVAEASLSPSAALGRVSLLKSRMADPEAFLASAASPEEELLGRAWKRYAASLARARQLDFDDILLEAVRLLGEHPAVLEELRERYQYLLVDEYQDTNAPQYELVRRLAGSRANLCVVGDDDQSIYGWRGADVAKILGFERDFPGAAVVRLETNYRSTQHILDAANRVIRNNLGRHEKSLRAARTGGERLRAIEHEDEEAEARWVVEDIQREVRERRARLADHAILFRTAIQPRPFEAELRARGIPYVLVGGMSFFDRKEVRDLLAYLKLVHNPRDELSLLRILDAPPRGVGRTTLERVLRFAAEHGLDATEAFARSEEIAGVGAAARTVGALLERLAELGRAFGPRELPALVRRVLDEVGYAKEIERAHADPRVREQRWAAVLEVVRMAENHVRGRRAPSLGAFLSEVALAASDEPDAESAERRDALTLMTLHAAKGLEFPRVVLVGLEEGILPHARALAEGALEEERRLMYVGITRAREGLTLSWTRSRARGGGRSLMHPSRFLFELKGEAPPPDWVAAGEGMQGEPVPRESKARATKKRAPAAKRSKRAAAGRKAARRKPR